MPKASAFPSVARTWLAMPATVADVDSSPPITGENWADCPSDTTSGKRSPLRSRKSRIETVSVSDFDPLTKEIPAVKPSVSDSEIRETARAPAKTDGSGTDGKLSPKRVELTVEAEVHRSSSDEVHCDMPTSGASGNTFDSFAAISASIAAWSLLSAAVLIWDSRAAISAAVGGSRSASVRVIGKVAAERLPL